MSREHQIFVVGKKDRKANKIVSVLMAAGIISLGGFIIGEYTGPTTTAEGQIVDKYRRSNGKTGSYKIDVQLTSGPFAGEVVTDTIGSLSYDDFDKGDTVVTDVTVGRFTGKLHGDDTQVVKRKP